MAMLGVWTHFVHPDDIIYTPDEVENPELVRNWFYLPWRGRNNEGLYFKFKNWVKDFVESYPFIRFMTCREAYEEMKRFDNLKIKCEFGDNEIKINTNQKNVFLNVQIDTKYKNLEVINAEIVCSSQGIFTNTVVLKTTDESVILKLD
ncbi:hypothetical protein (DUF2194) [Candidatus Kryptobacter tengchongensis]|nr:hypothetical protein (DUF2194) [Candidatus Kryptobacter tengchongensis]